MPERVAIFGGGVAGLSAAHELLERGFEVDVYEASDVVGGKARSLGVPNSATPGHDPLPGEHGFRFFPGFYKHLPDTLKRIQVGLATAFHHLVATDETLLARLGGQRNITTPNKFPDSVATLVKAFEGFTLFYCDLGVPKPEVAHFISKLVEMLVSCDARRFQDYESQSWFDFIDASAMSKPYRDYLAVGLSRSLVALNAKELSARTGACILLQFLMDFTGSTPLDRVLDLPTNDAWLAPWLNQLIADVHFHLHLNAPLDGFEFAGSHVSKVRVKIGGVPTDVFADHYIAAVPVEVMQQHLTPDLIAADPTLGSIADLRTSWMTGIIFYLNRDVPIVRGHTNYLDSDWALTSISQPQFWPALNIGDYGDGSVKGIISVIISNWGPSLFGGRPPAIDCTEQQVIDNVWEQLKEHLNSGPAAGPPVLSDGDLERVFIAPCLTFDPTAPPPRWTNKEQLFINTKGSWWDRPEAVTGIDNLYLASDYVRTHTDLATMEGANEAARRAVNGILDRIGSPQPRCDIWPMDEPIALEGYRLMDETLFFFGLGPLVPPIPTLPWPCP